MFFFALNQFSVTLQSEEQISESCQKTVTGVASQGSTITSYSKHDEFCVNMAKTHVSITIPLTATPAFVTDLGKKIKIVLHTL